MRYETRSEYVKERIRRTPWSGRGEIAPLLTIERYALRGSIQDFIHSMQLHALWSSEHEAFCTIISELNPELLEYWLARDERVSAEDLELEREEQKARMSEYRSWIAAGGKP